MVCNRGGWVSEGGGKAGDGYHSFEVGESKMRGGISSSRLSPEEGCGMREGPCGVIPK